MMLLNLSRPLSHITRVRNYSSALPDSEKSKLFAEFKKGITVLLSGGGIGTGFVVDKKKGHVLTAAHNLLDVTDAEELVDVLEIEKALKFYHDVQLTPYGIKRHSKTVVAAIAPVYDLALLKMDPRLLANAIDFQFSKEDIPVGSSVFSIIHGDARYLFRSGMVSSSPIPWGKFTSIFRRATSCCLTPFPRDMTLMNVDMCTAFGSSGAPVFGPDGKVIGVVKSGGIDDSDHSTYVVPSRHVLEFLRLFEEGLLKNKKFGGQRVLCYD